MSDAEFGSMILMNGLLVSTEKAEGVARVFVPRRMLTMLVHIYSVVDRLIARRGCW